MFVVAANGLESGLSESTVVLEKGLTKGSIGFVAMTAAKERQ